MIQRRKPLRRKTPLKRGGYIKRVSKKRASERSQYNRARLRYLEAHPFCQITLAREKISERTILTALQRDEINDYTIGSAYYKGVRLLRATQIHHRNKGRGARLLDERWWMAASQTAHDWVEEHKDQARELGLLLPIQADADGRWGSGQQALTTTELIGWRTQC